MCDTVLAPPNATGGPMLFGKNSDRDRNEAQSVEILDAGIHAEDDALACTYIAIPQAPQTHRVMLCRPFWMWGAEMGANEHGVVIGNEGLRAKWPAPRDEALTGMDLVRLGLERASSAAAAVDVITGLLGKHGQGGNCGLSSASYYHNGFMIADPIEAFVLETVDREWVLERVRRPRAISNTYSISADAEAVSPGLGDLVGQSGRGDDRPLPTADALADPTVQHIGSSPRRMARATALMEASGELDVESMVGVLRDHGESAHLNGWNPEQDASPSLCMHAGDEQAPAQTTASMVSDLRLERHVHWVTGTAAPCLSIFKPVLIQAVLPGRGPQLNAWFDPSSLWWAHERLHRAAVSSGITAFVDTIRPERDALEASFRVRLDNARLVDDVAIQSRIVAQCWAEAGALEARWSRDLIRVADRPPSDYYDAWVESSKVAGMVPSTFAASTSI